VKADGEQVLVVVWIMLIVASIVYFVVSTILGGTP
jgi:hypothetical protein